MKDVSSFIKVAVASRQAFKEHKSHSFKNSTFSVKRKSVLYPRSTSYPNYTCQTEHHVNPNTGGTAVAVGDTEAPILTLNRSRLVKNVNTSQIAQFNQSILILIPGRANDCICLKFVSVNRMTRIVLHCQSHTGNAKKKLFSISPRKIVVFDFQGLV